MSNADEMRGKILGYNKCVKFLLWLKKTRESNNELKSTYKDLIVRKKFIEWKFEIM